MSAWWAYAGAALLVAATVPQAVRLVRTRRADDLAWSFVGLNVVGIALLGARSAQIGEWGFVAVNASTTAFWLLAASVKARGERWPRGWRRARRGPASPIEEA